MKLITIYRVVNKKNFRLHTENNPLQPYQPFLLSDFVIVWCAIVEFGVLGNYSFAERHSVTVTSERYENMLHDFLMPRHNKLRDEA